jgi:hypothetical protein
MSASTTVESTLAARTRNRVSRTAFPDHPPRHLLDDPSAQSAHEIAGRLVAAAVGAGPTHDTVV